MRGVVQASGRAKRGLCGACSLRRALPLRLCTCTAAAHADQICCIAFKSRRPAGHPRGLWAPPPLLPLPAGTMLIPSG